MSLKYCVNGKINDVINELCQKKLFGNFYKIFLKTASLYFHERIKESPEICFESILEPIFERIENIPIRVLIADIHKEKDRLLGQDSYEKYDYYQRTVLNNEEHVREICSEYPVLRELILHQIYQLIEYLCEIQDALKQDKDMVQKKFCDNKEFTRVLNMTLNLSDPHGNFTDYGMGKMEKG